MAQRRQTTAMREELAEQLRRDCASGALRPGQRVPTARELQHRYGLSSRVVVEELQKLVTDGILVSRPRVGIFVADHQVSDPLTYLMMIPPDLGYRTWPLAIGRARDGFEEQVTRLGGVSVVLQTDSPLLTPPRIPAVAGIFAAGARDDGELRGLVPPEVPRVRWQTMPAAETGHPEVDTVAPDHVGAGRRATEHLLRRHHRIAFLGLRSLSPHRQSIWHWSALCEQGWQQAMDDADLPTDRLSFHAELDSEDLALQPDLLAEVATDLLTSGDATAVVCASTTAMQGLVTALDHSGQSAITRPELVTIGVSSSLDDEWSTTIRVPYEDLGREAAQMLWRRTQAEITGPGHHTVVPMPMSRRADPRLWSPTTH